MSQQTQRTLTVVDKSTKALLAASAGVTKVVQDLNEAATTRELSAAANAKLNAVESNHKVEIATINANSKSLEQTNTFLRNQVAELQGQIVAEREARVAVNTGK